MNIFFTTLFTFICVLLFTNCASHKDVRAGADGSHRVITRAAAKNEAERNALNQARSYCKTLKKSPAIVSEQTKYTGSMDEATHNKLRRATEVARTAGMTMGTSLDESQRKRGQNIATGAHVASGLEDDEAYTTTMIFQCQ